MSQVDERAVTAAVLRGIASGVGMASSVTTDPVSGGITKGIELTLGLVATLVETVGKSKADEILAELVKNPAQPISAAELESDEEKVKREFGAGQ